MPPSEPERLRSLAEYEILDTLPEQSYDDLTKLAAHVCETPVALISIVDECRQWFKSTHGAEFQETPRDVSFCAHVVEAGHRLVISDLSQDERFHDNPFVLQDPHLRFYAGQPLVSYDGHVLGTLCVLDTAPRTLDDKQLELLSALARQVMAQLELRRELSHRKKLEEIKDEFISTVSHELRTPLTSIRGALGLVVGGALGDIPPKFATMLEIAASNADRLVRLINDILDVEKMSAGAAELRRDFWNLSDICQTASEENADYARRYGVSFKLELQSDQVTIFADRDRIRQVIDNLLSNAAKYSPRGADVTVRVSAQGASARVEVEDTGAGIPPEFEPRIFQRFAQADSSDTRRRGGTGLGLAIAKQIVESHGGTIGYHSDSDTGSTFFFTLPRASSPAETIDVPPNSHVLVVEDDAAISALLQATLESKGYRVTLAHRADAAIAHLKHTRFDAITLDLGLPDQDGFSIIRLIRDTPGMADIPVIVVSGMADRRGPGASQDGRPVTDWIVKPFEPRQLLSALSAAARSQTELPRVLHVEDDNDLSQVIATCLAGSATIQRATSLAQARAAIAQVPFDLVVLDLDLPDGDGRDLLSELGESAPRVPIVIFSERAPEQAISERVQGVLVKTRQTEQDLVRAIVELLEER